MSLQPSKENPTALPEPVSLDRDSVVVYYAVDTYERFMQSAVDEDLRALRAACELTPDATRRARINWIAFVNSHFVDGTPSYLRCKDGEFAEEAYPETLLKSINLKLKKVKDPATYASLPDEMRQLKIQGYNDYPFAHFEVLGKVLNHARKTFPQDDHVFHLHIKSHGSAKLALTGLTETQWKAKDECQKALLVAKNQTLPEIARGESGLTRAEDGSVQSLGIEGQVVLGEDGQIVLGGDDQMVLGDDLPMLGEPGEDGIVLDTGGQIVLGDEMGLGADAHFGSDLGEVLSVVSEFVDSLPNTNVGYVILEGCYSAGGESFLQAALPFTQSFLKKKLNKVYAAKGSLWYRNFDWSRMLATWLKDDAAASSNALMSVVDARAKDVVNWKKTTPP